MYIPGPGFPGRQAGQGLHPLLLSPPVRLAVEHERPEASRHVLLAQDLHRQVEERQGQSGMQDRVEEVLRTWLKGPLKVP